MQPRPYQPDSVVVVVGKCQGERIYKHISHCRGQGLRGTGNYLFSLYLVNFFLQCEEMVKV